jgi:hypothetical protein
MNPWTLPITPDQRALLREFERVHEEWRLAIAAADAVECVAPPEKQAEAGQAHKLLEYRVAAERLHQQAMQMLRDSPL